MPKNNRKDVAQQRDLNLLYEMYKCRALSTAQVAHIRGLGKWYVYEKLGFLRNNGYIYTEQISGKYILQQNRQGTYHRISGKGITLLKKNGYTIDYTADDIRLSKHRLPYLLTANDLFLALQNTGWTYRDSREIKSFHILNRNDMLQGTLTNPDNSKEYALYIFLKKVYATTLMRIKQEINRNPFESALITTRGAPSFNSVIHSFANETDKLIKGGSIKVIPFNFATGYLNISSDNKAFHELFLSELGLNLLNDTSSKNAFESNTQFDYVVKHNEEEKYFLDLLDNDLMKLEEIKRYRKEDYKRDGKKILALTSTIKSHVDFHKKMLSDIQHIEYLVVNPQEVLAFAQHIQQKCFWKES
ncbi:hypothetical protein WMZ97_16575 [Lentibacillus sp. N15]|uniref:hypothetical protein n=1 Tax=Lentibacillus songyuanensis TaxID=3136161 RepID=UPI0031BBB978